MQNVNLEALMNMKVLASVVIAEKDMKFKEIKDLAPGAILYFEKSYLEPVAFSINNKAIAKGQVVKMHGKFGFQVKEIGSPGETIHLLG